METDFKMVPFSDSNRVEDEEKTDEFKKLFACLKNEIHDLGDNETKLGIVESLELLEKVDDEKLKDNLFITRGIIDNIKDSIRKYETRSSEEKTKENILAIIEDIEEHCEKSAKQV